MQSETAKINIDDATLVKQCRRGDSAAMQRLILKYQHRIYNAILRICANADDAVELTQDTFVKVLENIDKFQGRSGFYTWVFRIATNLTLNHCKRSVKLGLRSLDETQQVNDEQVGQALKRVLDDESSPDPAELAQNRELCEYATRALTKLEESQRAVLVLREIEGMSYAQICEVLNIELGTVKSKLSRARANLREILEAIL